MHDRHGRILILSPHVMTAALVGWYVELLKLEPAFAAPNERPEESLARVKPLLVVLIDSQLEAGLSDLLVARVAKRGCGLAVFGSSPDSDRARVWAAEHRVRYFDLPLDLESFGRALDLTAREAPTDRRTKERRAAPAVERAVDGTLVFIDPSGSPWYVYDRRGRDRRAGGGGYRSFVDAGGVERRCALEDGEFAAREPAELNEQLARSAQVPPNHS